MQFIILSMVLGLAAAIPLEQRSPLVYCDQVQVEPGFGPGPACTPRPSSSPSSSPLYCDEVHIEPGFGPGPACVQRDGPSNSTTPSNTTYSDGNNPNGLISCKDLDIPAGFGPGPACYDPDLQDKVDDFAGSG